MRTKADQSYRAQEDRGDTAVVVSSSENVVEDEEGGSGNRDDYMQREVRLIRRHRRGHHNITRLDLQSSSRPGQLA